MSIKWIWDWSFSVTIGFGAIQVGGVWVPMLLWFENAKWEQFTPPPWKKTK